MGAFEGEMARFRYHFSRNPGTLSPPTGELLTIEAGTRAEAIERIRANDAAPVESASVWLNFLVWVSVNGEQRGFASTRLR